MSEIRYKNGSFMFLFCVEDFLLLNKYFSKLGSSLYKWNNIIKALKLILFIKIIHFIKYEVKT